MFLCYGKVRLVFGRPRFRISSATASILMEIFRDIPLFFHTNTSNILPALFLSRLLPDPSSSVFTTNSTIQQYTVSCILRNFNSVVTHNDFHSPFCPVSFSPHTAPLTQRPVLSKADLPADWHTHTNTHTSTQAHSVTWSLSLFSYLAHTLRNGLNLETYSARF